MSADNPPSAEDVINAVFAHIAKLDRSKACPLVLDDEEMEGEPIAHPRSLLDLTLKTVDGVTGRLLGGRGEGEDLDVTVTRLPGDGVTYRISAGGDALDGPHHGFIGRPLALLLGRFDLGTFETANCALSHRGAEVACASDDEYGVEEVREGSSSDVALVARVADVYARLSIEVMNEDLVGAFAVVELKGESGWEGDRFYRRRMVKLTEEPLALDDFLPLVYDGSPTVTVRPVRHEDLDLLCPDEVTEVCGECDFVAASAIDGALGWEFKLTESQLEECCRAKAGALVRLDLGDSGESATVKSMSCSTSNTAAKPVQAASNPTVAWNASDWIRAADNYNDRLLGFAKKLVGEDATDAVQNTWTRVIEKEQVNPHAPALLGYMFNAVRYACLELQRNQRHRNATFTYIDDVRSPTVNDDQTNFELESRERHPQANAELTEAMATLSEEEKELVRMRFYDGMSLDEIKDVIGVKHVGTVTRRIQKLRDRIDAKALEDLVSDWLGKPLQLSISSEDHWLPTLRRLSETNYSLFEVARVVGMTRVSDAKHANCEYIEPQFFNLVTRAEEEGWFGASLAELKATLKKELDSKRPPEDVAREHHMLMWKKGVCRPIKWFEALLAELGYKWTASNNPSAKLVPSPAP